MSKISDGIYWGLKILKQPERARLRRSVVMAMLFLLADLFDDAAGEVIPDAQSLVTDLKKGGYILLFRHADKYAWEGQPARPEKLGRTLPDDCNDPNERELLNEHGVTQAQNIGSALSAIPVGKVLASKACRTIETAEIAFGKPTALHGELTAELTAAPDSGTNTVIVSHSNLIKSALTNLNFGVGRMLFCGEAAVVDPIGNNGRPKLVRLVSSNEWNPRTATDLEWVNRRECDTRP